MFKTNKRGEKEATAHPDRFRLAPRRSESNRTRPKATAREIVTIEMKMTVFPKQPRDAGTEKQQTREEMRHTFAVAEKMLGTTESAH